MTEILTDSPVLARLKAAIVNGTPGAPIAEWMGWKTVEAEPGRVVMEMEVGPHLANPMGTLHGGVLCGLADSAMAMAHATTLKAAESFTTLELKINFVRPVWNGKLRAEGKILKGGREVSLAECQVTTPEGQLVAHATCTCLTLRGEDAAGR